MRPITRNLTYAMTGLLVLSGVAFAFHDAIFRYLTLRLAHQVPGLEVGLDGRFDVTHVFPITVVAEKVRLAFKEGALEGSRVRLGELHLEIRVGPLLRGLVQIGRLMIRNADIEIPPRTAAKPADELAYSIPIPIIEALRLDQINMRFQLKPDARTHDVSIASLDVGAGDNGDLKASGTASFDGEAVELTADSGSVEELLRPTAPFPVTATLRAPSRDLDIRVAGTLIEPLLGRGAKLDIHATAADVSPLWDMFLPPAPFGGAVDVSARLDGDLRAPEVSNLAMTINDGDRLRVEVGGRVANPMVGEGLDLRVETASQDAAVTRYLLRDAIPAARTMRLRAGIRGGADDMRIESFEADLSGAKSLSLNAKGAMHLSDLEAQWPIQSANLDLNLSADVASLKTWLPEAIPETGRVRAKTHIDGSGDTLAFKDVELMLDGTRPLHGTLRGEIAYSVPQLEAIRARHRPSADEWVPATGNLTMELATADFESLSALLGRTLPDLGPVSATARLRRNGDAIEVTALHARTAGKRPLSLTTEGRLTIADVTSKKSLRDVTLQLRAKGPDAGSVAHIIGPLPIDPGPWSLQAHVAKTTGKFRVDTLEFESGRSDTVRVKLDGEISDLESLIASAGRLPTGVTLEGHVAAASTKQLGDLIGVRIPELGRVDARFDARGEKDDWSVPRASVAVTGAAGFQFKATGKASALLRDARFDSKLVLQVPDPQRTVMRAGGSIPQIAAISVDGELQGDREQGRFKGRIDVGATQFESQLEVRLADPRPIVTGEISTPVLQVGDFVSSRGSSSESTDGLAAADTALGEQAAETEDRVLSDQPLRFDLLRHADVDLELTAGKMEGERIRTERLELFLRVAGGRLIAHHSRLKHADSSLKYAHGSVATVLEIDNATDPPTVSIKGRADNVSLGALHAQVSDAPQLLEGLFSYDVDLTGSGHSMHALLSSANGRFGYVIEDTKLTGGDIDLLTFHALRLLMATVVSKDHTTIDCAIAEFKADNGVATSQNLFLRTPKMIATGNGQLDFGDETVDFLVNTEARRHLLKRKTVLRIHGPMKHLEIDTNLGPRALSSAAEATAMITVPPLGFSMAGLAFLGGFIVDGEKRPCIPHEPGGRGDGG